MFFRPLGTSNPEPAMPETLRLDPELAAKAEKLLEDHGDDIMTAVHEHTNAGDIIYVETLLDTL